MSNLATETIPGSPDGMNVAFPASEIKDTEAQYIQDALLDLPALTRRRGPVRDVATIAQPTYFITNGAVTLDPQGNVRKALLTGDATHGNFAMYSADDLTMTTRPWANNLGISPYHVSHISTGLKGGAFLGTSSQYDTGSTQALAYWLGGNKVDYTTGTLTVTRGGTTVTGVGTAWATNAAPGMWLFANTDDPYTNTLIGYVKSVTDDTHLVLATPSPYAATAKSYTLQSLRGVYPRVNTGRITCDTTAAAVNGGNTKFAAQGMGTGSWNIYRARDWTWVGKVSAVNSDSSITLAANAAISMADEAYIALRADGDWGLSLAAAEPGWITATYAGRQFFLNNGDTHEDTFRLAYSDVDDPEAVDLSDNGTWTPVVSQGRTMQESVRGALAAYNALIITKESETFGLFGSTPNEFALQKIADDGALSGMSLQQYNGGVLWAGGEGIYYYDGVQVTNLMTAKFGQVWKDSIRTFDPSAHRMWSMLIRDHYVLFVESIEPTIQPAKGGVPEVISTWTVVINMTTLAPVMWTNVNPHGSIQLPAASGSKTWYFINTASSGHVCSGDDLFDTEALDTVTSNGAVAGPDFYYESKKFDVGDQLRLKKFKVLAMHYLAQGGALKIDVVLGLNEFGQTLSSSFPASVFTWDTLRAQFGTWNALKTEFSTWAEIIQGVLLPKRVKFQKSSQFFSFRVYQENLSMPRVKIGPYQLGFKLMRPGRV